MHPRTHMHSAHHLHTKIPSLLRSGLVALFAIVVTFTSAGLGQFAVASPGRVLGTTTVPAPVSSLTTKADFVSYLYRCMLQREPDQSGVDYWVGTMAVDPDPFNHLYHAFYQAGEFNKNISNTEFVTRMYQCTLFRQPSDAPDNNNSGRDFWANEMSSGNQSQAGMLEVFLGSTEFRNNILPKLSTLPISVAAPQSPVIISLSASQLSTTPGGSVYLSWSVGNATADTITFNNNIGRVSSSGNLIVNPTTTTTYTLSGKNSLGAVSKSVTITVAATVPTPTVAIIVATPSISPNGGTFTGSQQITLSDTTPTATIRYTLDDSEPTASSPAYTSPLTISATTKVKAKAFAAGYQDSAVTQAAFTINPIPTPAVNLKPVGYLDVIDTSTAAAYGWSYDPDDATQSVDVHFYIDALGSDHFAGYVKANQDRPDVGTTLNIPGSHGFAWTIPDKYKDGKQHTLFAFGIDLTDTTGSSNSALPPAQKFTIGAYLPPLVPATADDFIKSLHSCIWGRGAGDAETASWKNKFNSNGDVAELYRLFYGNTEFRARGLTESDFIHTLYSCILFRANDPAQFDKDGFSYWLIQVNSGRSWESTLDAFLASGEFGEQILPKLIALRSAVVSQTNLDARLAVTHMSGFYPNWGPDFMVKGAQDARSLGFQGIELYIAPEICSPTKDSAGRIIKPGGYQTLDWCDSRPGASNISPSYDGLAELAAHPRYKNVFNQDFKNYFLTTETINPDRDEAGYPEPSDCAAAELYRINAFNIKADCYKDGFSTRQLKSLHDDFYGFAKHLLSTYKGTGKTFIIQTANETEAHIETSSGVFPDYAMNNAKSYLNTISDAIHEAVRDNPVSGVKVYHGCEFTGLNKTTYSGAKNPMNNLVPQLKCDLYSWSYWDLMVDEILPNPDKGDYSAAVTKALDYFASKAPNNHPDFAGKRNVYISEMAVPEDTTFRVPGGQTIGVTRAAKALNSVMDTALSWGSPYVVYWQMYENSCNVFPLTSANNCSADPNVYSPPQGYWLRKPAADPTQLGPLSGIYDKVFVPRKVP